MQASSVLKRFTLGVIAMSQLFGVLPPATAQAQPGDKIVVAHRGASGYLPEHSLPAKAMAYAMGADYIEQDVVMTRDDQLIVIHDITLDRTTDVAQRFPGRAREDGKHYAVDFTLDEILSLRVTEGFTVEDGQKRQLYPERFPMETSIFRVHTLAQEIELVQGLNRSTGRNVGIYPEIKSPAFHLAEGKDLGRAVIKVLKDYGYTRKSDRVFVQTFEFDELKRLHDEILPEVGIRLNLVQLLDGGDENAWMQTQAGVAEIARYADGLGPEKSMIVDRHSPAGSPRISALVGYAHANGLQVHPYTFRLDPGQLPDYVDSFEQMLEIFYFQAGVDGVFTDFPDRAVNFLRKN